MTNPNLMLRDHLTNLSILIILIGMLQLACGKKKFDMLTLDDNLPKPVLTGSTLNLKIKISRYEVNALINDIVSKTFQEGFTYEDGFKIITRQHGTIDLQAMGQELQIQLPLYVEITPSGIFKQFQVSGAINIILASKFDIFQGTLISKTEIKQHQWTKKPVVNVMGIKLPIEGIGNFIIKKYKQTICKSIDESITKNIRLSELSKTVHNNFIQPVYSSEDKLIHVFANPTELAVGPMNINGEYLEIPVIFNFESVLSDSIPHDFGGSCNFSIQPFFENASLINIQSRIPVTYIENKIRQQVINQTYGSGVTKIKVNEIFLKAAGKIMQLELVTEGSYKGELLMQFIPEFNESNRKIELDQFQLKAKKGGSLNKIVFTLVKGIAESRIKNSIEDQLNLTLKEFEINTIQLMNQKNWYPGVMLQGELIQYNLKNMQYYNDRLYFNLEARLSLEVHVTKISRDKLVLYKF